MSNLVPTAARDGAAATVAAVRRVAGAIRQCTDEAALAGQVNELFRIVPLLRRTSFEPGDPGAALAAFAPDTYTLPLRGSGKLRGILRHPLEGAQLGGDELNMLHAAADLLGALLDLAVRVRESRRIAALLQFVVDQMPVGVVCLGPRPAVLASNRAAVSFLGCDPLREKEAAWLLLHPAVHKHGFVRCLSRGERIAVVDVRTAPGADPEVAGAVVLVMDCTESMRTFHDGFARETYRCLCEKLPLTVAAIAAPMGIDELVATAEVIRSRLPAGGICGLFDPETFGIVLPGLDPTAAVRVLRGLELGRATPDLLVGLAALDASVRAPEVLLELARATLAPWAAAVRPEVFVFDQAAVVTQSLAFVLRGCCAVSGANNADQGRKLLARRAYDGMILELPAQVESAAGDFAREAVRLQPGARTFFVTHQPLPWSLSDWGLPEGVVFRKPFVVREVRAAVQAAFARDGG